MVVKAHSFSRKMHLKTSAEFERVYATRRWAQDATLKTMVAPNNLEHSRLGLSVGKRYGNAVRRNRFKRLVREAFRTNREQLPNGFDIVVIPRTRSEPTLEMVTSSLVGLVSKVARLS